MKEPLSTVSNAFYAVAGAYAIAYGAVGYGLACILLAVCSGGFHATLNWKWQASDECAMYVVLCVLSSLYGVPLFIALLAAGLLCANWNFISSFTTIPILAAVNLVLIAISSPVVAFAAGVTALVAFVIRQDAERDGSDFGHALWHFLTAAALSVVVPG